MEKSQRILTFITFLICTLCLALLTASLTTHKWIVVRPVRLTFINGSIIEFNQIHSNRSSHHLTSYHNDNSHISLKDSLTLPSLASSEASGDGKSYETSPDVPEYESRKFRGKIYFGLFQGTKILNYGFGDRISYIWMKDELLRNPNLMPFGLWLFTILCVAIAIIFGVVSIIFAIINTIITPIEIITGLQGLYLWNGMGSLFCTGACVSWIIQFRTKLRKNVLTSEEIQDGWSSENRALLGYSFFLVVIALFLFLLNILLVSLATRKPWIQRRAPRPLSDKNPEGVIMLY